MIAAFNAGAGILGFPTGGWLSDVAVRRGIGRKPLVIAFTAAQFVLTLIFGFVVAAGAANVWLMAALLFSASTFFNAMQPIAQAMLADIAAPEHHGAAFGMNNLIGEIGAVLSPAVSGALRDATGGWSAAVFVDAALIGGARSCSSCSCARRRGPRRRGPPDRFRRAPASGYGVVVDRVNVSVFAVRARAQRVVGADRLLEPSVTGRWRPGRRRSAGRRVAEPPTSANAPALARACSVCGSANAPLTSLPVFVGAGSATRQRRVTRGARSRSPSCVAV